MPAYANAATTTTAAPPKPQHQAAPTSPLQRWLDPEGRRYSLRALQAQDAALLGSLWNEGLSRPARFNRFHASLACISPERLAAWCQPAATQGQALVITQLLPGGEKAVAEGRWAWTSEPGQAELALSVADRCQGWGLGRRMLQALLQAAQGGDAQVLQAQVLAGNGAMQALLQQAGFVAPLNDAGSGWGHDFDPHSSSLSFELRLPSSPPRPLHRASRAKPVLAQAGLLWNQWLGQVAMAASALRLRLRLHTGGGSPLRSPARRQLGGLEALN